MVNLPSPISPFNVRISERHQTHLQYIPPRQVWVHLKLNTMLFSHVDDDILLEIFK